MAMGSSRGSWLLLAAVAATALGFVALGTVTTIKALSTLAQDSSLMFQELQQLAFNAREFGERMGRFVGAGLALGLAGIGAGIAVGVAGAAAISAFTEKPEVFGRAFIIVVLGEGIAIYGIAIAILIMILGVP